MAESRRLQGLGVISKAIAKRAKDVEYICCPLSLLAISDLSSPRSFVAK